MKSRITVVFIILVFLAPGQGFGQSKLDKDTIEMEILKNGQIIRDAFAAGNIEVIKSLHHPNVIKALGYNDVKIGRNQVIDGLVDTLNNFTLEFMENDVENILIRDSIAIEQTRFTIKGTPNNGGEPFVFKGRTMVTYVRYPDSPTGWATIREIIQPFTE